MDLIQARSHPHNKAVTSIEIVVRQVCSTTLIGVSQQSTDSVVAGSQQPLQIGNSMKGVR